MINTPAVWEKYWFPVTRIARRAMDAMLQSKQAHRLECISHYSREKAFKWYSALGYNKEATLYGYCADGSDAVLFSRVKH
jgi:ribosomal protein S18 acetylase RimI-like enzyme